MCERECVCVLERERERECVCMREREKERGRVCVCVCERERERKREGECVYVCTKEREKVIHVQLPQTFVNLSLRLKLSSQAVLNVQLLFPTGETKPVSSV